MNNMVSSRSNFRSNTAPTATTNPDGVTQDPVSELRAGVFSTETQKAFEKPKEKVLEVVATAAGSSMGPWFGDEPRKPTVRWQWEHRTGFKDYDDRASERIETAFQKGLGMVRMKSGKKGSVPMEVFFHDLIQHDPISGSTRRVRREGPNGPLARFRRRLAQVARRLETGRSQKVTFAEYQVKRTELMHAMSGHGGLVRNLTDLYKHRGFFGQIVDSYEFFFVTSCAIVLFSVWMVVEAEFNDAPTFSQSLVGFQVVEYVFFIFFILELIVRFLAFERKRRCFKDTGFMVDSVLVLTQSIEILVIPAIFAGNEDANAKTAIGYFRVMRLLRLSRLRHLLKVFPEVRVLVRGMASAVRPMCTTLLMLVVLLLSFAMVFKTQASDHEELRKLFPTILDTTWLLLLRGTFLDSMGSLAFYPIYQESGVLALVFLVFVFLSSFMILNMLIGILCNVVFNVSQMEKDEAAVSLLKTLLLDILECYDKNDNRHIEIDEFFLIMRNPEMHQVLHQFNVDPGNLLAMSDYLFAEASSAEDIAEHHSSDTEKGDGPPGEGDQDKERKKKMRALSFSEFLEVVLRLRGTNIATVMDVVEFREYMRKRIDGLDRRVVDERSVSKTRNVETPETAPGTPATAKEIAELRRELHDLNGRLSEMQHQLGRLLHAQGFSATGAQRFGSQGFGFQGFAVTERQQQQPLSIVAREGRHRT